MTHDALADLNMVLRELAKAIRVVIVHPDREAAAREAVAAAPFPGLLHVEVSAHCPVDRIFFVPRIEEFAAVEPCEHDTLGCRWREPHDAHTKAGDGRPCCGWPPQCEVGP